jgi:hypothetical protein
MGIAHHSRGHIEHHFTIILCILAMHVNDDDGALRSQLRCECRMLPRKPQGFSASIPSGSNVLGTEMFITMAITSTTASVRHDAAQGA